VDYLDWRPPEYWYAYRKRAESNAGVAPNTHLNPTTGLAKRGQCGKYLEPLYYTSHIPRVNSFLHVRSFIVLETYNSKIWSLDNFTEWLHWNFTGTKWKKKCFQAVVFNHQRRFLSVSLHRGLHLLYCRHAYIYPDDAQKEVQSDLDIEFSKISYHLRYILRRDMMSCWILLLLVLLEDLSWFPNFCASFPIGAKRNGRPMNWNRSSSTYIVRRLGRNPIIPMTTIDGELAYALLAQWHDVLKRVLAWYDCRTICHGIPAWVQQLPAPNIILRIVISSDQHLMHCCNRNFQSTKHHFWMPLLGMFLFV
jgi:hypothetical protein